MASVIWMNNDIREGILIMKKGFMIVTGLLKNGESVTITFDKVGEFAYHCTPHPNMKTNIIVTE